MDTDSLRTSHHNSVIIRFNMLARYLRMQGKKAEWRDKLGNDEENRYYRKTIGDFGCYIVFVNSICARWRIGDSVNDWYILLRQNYNSNIGLFLEHFSMNEVGVAQNQINELYAILRLCVEYDDAESIRKIFLKIPVEQIQGFEENLFDNKDMREMLLSKYHFDDLSLWGTAINGRRKASIIELKNHFLHTTCCLSRWMTAWDILLSMKEWSDSYWQFCADNFEISDDENLFLLLLLGRDNLAEKKLKELDLFDRKYILDQVQEDKNEKEIWKYTLSISMEVSLEQGDQILTQLIEMITKINANNVWNCIGTIKKVEAQNDDMRLIVETDTCCYIAEIDSSPNCCEVYGGYIICEDDVTDFIGSSLLRITLTDTALSAYIVREINSIQNGHGSCDLHNIQFINFETTKGVLQYVVYNCHNGYYGHDISIRQNNKLIYVDRI